MDTSHLGALRFRLSHERMTPFLSATLCGAALMQP
jgi:hypothetical protein